MNNSIEYHSTLLARKLYHESQAKAKQAEPSVSANLEAIIPATDTQTELTQYPIFLNPACGAISAQEAQQGSKSLRDYWFHFYPPQTHLLPQQQNLNKLTQQHQTLRQLRAKLYAPRLFILTVLTGMLVLFLLTLNIWFIVLTLFLAGLIWAKTHANIHHNNLQLAHNQHCIQQQQQLLQELEQQAQQIIKPVDAKLLQQNYTYQLETWLHDSVNEFFPSLSASELKVLLQQEDINFFLLESRAVLQLLPNKANSSREALLGLLSHKGASLFALQPFAELEGLSRLHYLYAVLCFEQGVVMCTAYYDWLKNELSPIQQDFHPYREMMDVHHADLRPKEQNPIKNYLNDELFQQQIREPLQVISLGLRNGTEYTCALSKIPLHRRTYMQIPHLFFTHYLKRDLRQLIATMTQHTGTAQFKAR